MAIRTIVCCCGMGLGTSLLAKMNVEKALSVLGVKGVFVEHSSISEAAGAGYDLYVVSRDLAGEVKDLSNTVILDSIMDSKEIEARLKPVFGLP